MEKIKIFFFIPTLEAGGAERIISYVSQNLNQDIFNCKLIVLSSRNKSSYQVNDLDVIWLNKSRVLFSIWSIEKLIRHNKPDVVVSSITHLNIIMGWISLFHRSIQFVGRQSTISGAVLQFRNNSSSWFSTIIRKIGFKNLDYIICQSKDMALDCNQILGIDYNRIHIINNPITKEFALNSDLRKKFRKENNVIRFITVGRLVPIKGHARLLKILSKCNFDFVYTIIGDGQEMQNLIDLAKSLNIEEKIRFIGRTEKVANHLHLNDYFLQGSYSEGFPNAILESCAAGTPVIAFDCPGGTSEIIDNGINGFLAKDEVDFLHYLNKQKEFDPFEVSTSVFSKFSSEKIIDQYERFFLSIVRSNNN